MNDVIRHEHVLEAVPVPTSGAASAPVLAGEIDGLRTVFHAIAPGASLTPQHREGEGRVFLFTSGQGWIEAGSVQQISEVTFYAPAHNTGFVIHAGRLKDGSGESAIAVSTDAVSSHVDLSQQSSKLPAGQSTEPLRVLELIVDLSATDQEELRQVADMYPLFLSYSDCKTYRERIKSEKTISRTLLPEHTFPRLCIGSVETTGDDRVAAHEHPMLEQLFFGLAGNDCVVRADEAELAFGDGVLLHIPLGSSHGVEVHAPQKLHYIWIDLFRDRQGMDWIVQEHITEP